MCTASGHWYGTARRSGPEPPPGPRHFGGARGSSLSVSLRLRLKAAQGRAGAHRAERPGSALLVLILHGEDPHSQPRQLATQLRLEVRFKFKVRGPDSSPSLAAGPPPPSAPIQVGTAYAHAGTRFGGAGRCAVDRPQARRRHHDAAASLSAACWQHCTMGLPTGRPGGQRRADGQATHRTALQCAATRAL
jgi:hypothetical protein